MFFCWGDLCPFSPSPILVGNWGSSWLECCLPVPRLWPWVPLLVSLQGSRAGASRCCSAAGQRGCWAPGQRDLHKARNMLNPNILSTHGLILIFFANIKEMEAANVCVWVQGRDSHISVWGQGKRLSLLQLVANICVWALKISQEILRLEKCVLLPCKCMIKPSSFFSLSLWESLSHYACFFQASYWKQRVASLFIYFLERAPLCLFYAKAL